MATENVQKFHKFYMEALFAEMLDGRLSHNMAICELFLGEFYAIVISPLYSRQTQYHYSFLPFMIYDNEEV